MTSKTQHRLLVEAAARRYLEKLPYQLWGDYLIKDERSQAQAVEWLANQFIGVTRELLDG